MHRIRRGYKEDVTVVGRNQWCGHFLRMVWMATQMWRYAGRVPSRSPIERDDSNRIAVHQGFGNLVDRTVASDSQHVGELLLYRLPGNLGGVAGITCNPENDIEMGLVKSGCDLLGDIFFDSVPETGLMMTQTLLFSIASILYKNRIKTGYPLF